MATTVPDGTYTVALAPRDLAGNTGGSLTRQVVVYTALKSVTSTHPVFYPQDVDALAKTTSLAFTLTRAATVTWTLANASGTVVYTRYDHVDLPAGTYPWTWNGRLPSGAMAPRGRYTLTVSATDGSASWTQRSTVYAQAFRIAPSTLTPARGTTFTVTAVSAESLRRAPRLTYRQPGHATKTLTMTRVSSTTWKVTVHLSSTGTGALNLRVSGTDTHGGYNLTGLVIAIH